PFSNGQNVCDSNYFGTGSPQVGGQSICNDRASKNTDVRTQVITIVDSINRALVFIAPAVAVISILVGAFLILQRGLQVGILVVQWAMIGLVVVMLSYGLLSTIILFFI
ncbi:MAG: hypothetical protein ACRCXZ_06195, partial [Patescibacteria group bacterium]